MIVSSSGPNEYKAFDIRFNKRDRTLLERGTGSAMMMELN